MRNLILALMVMVGFCVTNLAHADEARTIPMKYAGVKATRTLVSAQGVDLYRITGYASSSNCTFSVHNINSLTSVGSVSNVIAEGGEASQYDSFPTIDFGPEGLRADTGVVVYTTACDLTIQYR